MDQVTFGNDEIELHIESVLPGKPLVPQLLCKALHVVVSQNLNGGGAGTAARRPESRPGAQKLPRNPHATLDLMVRGAGLQKGVALRRTFDESLQGHLLVDDAPSL